MIKLLHSKQFDKHFDILSDKFKIKVEERLLIFVVNEFEPILNNHLLHGEYAGCKSINITGDIRLIYKKVDSSTCRLIAVGTHSQLFE